MTPRELYERYKGKIAIDSDGIKGIVVGYTITHSEYTLIMSVTNNFDLPWGKNFLTDNDFICNKDIWFGGYWYVNKEDITFKFGH